MPQLRRDPIIGRWVIISTERAKRPKDFKVSHGVSLPEETCHFCPGKEEDNPSEIFALKDHNGQWKVKVLSRRKPFLSTGIDSWKKGEGPYDLMSGIGRHEVIIETPKHVSNMADLTPDEIKDVFVTYCERIKEIEKEEYIKYVLLFKNYGWEDSESRVKHSRSQIIATPVNLKRVKEELEGAKFHFDCHERCIFCDMVCYELEQKERVVLEEDGFVALVPFAPRFPFEVWILPKKHSSDFYKTSHEDLYVLAQVVKKVLSKIKNTLGDPPYNYVIHSAPFRRSRQNYWATIEDDFHWHVEITPRLTKVAGFEWGTGFYICPSLPEESAQFLREG
ncbi:MAG: HIT domain-containing protein [Candidatus Omnitrophota bacterium]